jgi:DNA topoisomerase IA
VLSQLGPLVERALQPRPRPAQSLETPNVQSWPPLEASDLTENDSGFELVLQRLGLTPVAVDELVRQCHLSAAAMATLLLELELAGRVERHPGNLVSLRMFAFHLLRDHLSGSAWSGTIERIHESRRRQSPAKAKPSTSIWAAIIKSSPATATSGIFRWDGSVLDDFAIPGGRRKSEKHMKTILRRAQRRPPFLATDPDREGEAIPACPRGAFPPIKHPMSTGSLNSNENACRSIQSAARDRRELVEAYLARRALDYLVGFTLSPVLWRKLPGSRSAGRVQSVALRLICERESEIEAFKSREYWTIEVEFKTEAGQTFTARLTHLDGRRLDRFDLDTEAKARAAAEAILRASAFTVTDIDSRQVRRNPFPPFTTSTLQQEDSRKLGLAASRTMQIAQRLYEGIELAGETVGLITYMRTDGVAISAEAIAAARHLIGSDFGPKYLPDAPRVYRSPAKNAQEAHEAIRPTDSPRKPVEVAGHLDRDQPRLYELV